MKHQKTNKKLSLNKSTIAQISGKDMHQIHGGGIKPTQLNTYATCTIPSDTALF